ncbi:hypothetical protein LCGC14_1959090 [marine sediment metagenome]|uniref:Glucosamine/galactosamine-6-phosphate isomerase domain-containing protein n=1 Tax=marine sediment metagenome TaxID=412755 RepID=A0A0F9IC81_9ZZZZ
MFRYLPCRHPTGLVAVGEPGRDAAVFVSGNYFHSVRQVLKCLRGLDCYLLVVDSAGINVWCAAGAGDFTEHKIADAVNTYALSEAVDHRDLILPQLSAVGIDKSKLLAECGFRVLWGPADCRDLAAAAEQYENLIRRLVPPNENDVPAFDLILLGMGAEGHTASLFPDTPALAEKSRLVVAQFVPVIGRNRMTFTFPLINAARHVLFFVTGADKAPAVRAVLGEDVALKSHYPAGRVAPTAGRLIFVLDTPAAAGIQGA